MACSDGVGPNSAQLAIAGGDGQRAPVGSVLPEPIVVILRDARAKPLAGAHIAWSVMPGASDVVEPSSEVTDVHGAASASWRLDEQTGTHTIVVTADGGAAVHVKAIADPGGSSTVRALPIVTYEGSGQAVHPDFARLPASWTGDRLRLVATPYPQGDGSFENPSLYSGSTGDGWEVPKGVHNPLETPPLGSYLSDPDLLYDADADELRIYYRRVTSENEIWMIRSSNGVVWSAPVLSVHAPIHFIVSPTIVRRSAKTWLMWSVNSGTVGCGASTTTVELRRSIDGVTWGAPETTTISDPDGYPWHIDVEWIPSRNEYWAVYPVKKAGGCTTDRLRFATSTDGVHWTTFPSPVLMKGATDQLRDVVYRSSIDLDAPTGTVSIWYSGAKNVSGGYSWHLAWEQLTVNALLARVRAPFSVAARAAAGEKSAIPELTNETAP